MVAVRHRQIACRRIVAHGKHRTRHRMTLHERKIRRLVAEASFPVVAHKDQALAEQHQIEIAVVVVIDPYCLFIRPLRQYHRALLENALAVVIEQRTGCP